MGYAERNGRAMRVRLAGLTIAIDLGHRWKRGRRKGDRGAKFVIEGGRVTEFELAMHYGIALALWLKVRGAHVIHNDPSRGHMIGSYAERNREAHLRGAIVYLACHVNAGGGRYALMEYVSAPGRTGLLVRLGPDALGRSINARLEARYPGTITSSRVLPIGNRDRGAVTVREFPGIALIVEPFFGDNTAHHKLTDAPELMRLGQTIGEGVAAWWEQGKATRA